MHGKTSAILHDGKGLFANVPNNVPVIRYHSLAARVSAMPQNFVVTSRTAEGVIMGIRHNKFKIEGVQFHPESFKTENGMDMLKNFVSWKGGKWEENTAEACLSEVDSPSTIRYCLKLLSENKTLTSDHIVDCVKEIMLGTATHAHTGAFLYALRGDKISPDVLHACAKAITTFALPCSLEGDVIDVVGTGGDSVDTFNASTAAAMYASWHQAVGYEFLLIYSGQGGGSSRWTRG